METIDVKKLKANQIAQLESVIYKTEELLDTRKDRLLQLKLELKELEQKKVEEVFSLLD
jgi:hypothetical protein